MSDSPFFGFSVNSLSLLQIMPVMHTWRVMQVMKVMHLIQLREVLKKWKLKMTIAMKGRRGGLRAIKVF